MKTEKFMHNIGNKKTKARNVIITLLLTLLVEIDGFAQQFIDMFNAPLNPVGYIENKSQLHLKGDIAYLESEDYLNFDKNGNRLFMYYNLLDKEKARGTKSTYLELDNQKRLVYKENFFLEVKTFYTYNPNGTIAKIEVQSQYPSVRTFEYDNNKRMIKQTERRDAKTTVTDYAYQTNGNRIIISASETVTENNQSTSRTYQYTYENGLMIKYKEKDLEDTYTYTYDTKGNWLTKSSRFGTTKRQFYYHSELGEWDKWSWKYVKDYAWLPYLTIGNRNVYRLNYSSKDLDNFTDVLFFEPITGTTLIAENVVTANGLSKGVGNGKVRVLKAKNLMYKSVQGNIKFFVEGSNQSGNLKQAFVGKTYVIYDASSLQTYWCRDFEIDKKFNVFEDLGKDSFLWYKSEKNDFYFWQKGDYVTQALGFTLGTLNDDDNVIVYHNQKPVFVMENLTTSAQNIFYKAVPYSGQPIPKYNTQTPTTTAGANTLKETNVQSEMAEKPGAAFNSSLPLYMKEVSNGVYYFYQNGKRIQDPLYHQPTSMYKNKGIKCYYRTDKDYYFYVPGTEEPNANGKYLMSRLRGKYIYTIISKDEQNFVFEGKTLKSQDYDLIVSREKDCVLLVKEKGLMFEISSVAFPKQNETVTHAFSNSDALGSNSNIFIVFKENGEMVVAEKGKIQPIAYWKITKENDKNFLINNVDGRKYHVRIYNLEKTGIIQPQFINHVQ